jgi:hypothetical protein
MVVTSIAFPTGHNYYSGTPPMRGDHSYRFRIIRSQTVTNVQRQVSDACMTLHGGTVRIVVSQ